MAIIIPSKNIYSIDNQKVIDNQISKVEVDIKRPQLITDFDTVVSSQDFPVSTLSQGELQKAGMEKFRTASGSNITYVAVYVSMKPQYCSLVLSIPKKANNSIIQSIKSGVDKDGNADIKYSTVCTIYKSTASAKYNREGEQVIDVLVNYPPNGTDKTINLPKTLTETETIYDDAHLEQLVATANLTLNDETNLGTVIINEDNNNYYFSCKVLCGMETYVLKGKGKEDISNSRKLPVNGTATKYVPKQVSITVYGNVIKLDLQNDTIVLGDGEEVYSLTGNELMQFTGSKANITVTDEKVPNTTTDYKALINSGKISVNDILWYNGSRAIVTNTYDGYIGVRGVDTTDTSNKLIDKKNTPIDVLVYNTDRDKEVIDRYWGIAKQWNHGKEVATIKCGIEDYYDEEEIIINIIEKNSVNNIKFKSSADITWTDILTYQDYKLSNIFHVNGNYLANLISGDIESLPTGSSKWHKQQLAITKSGARKMLFSIGDTVIPYVCGTNGQDKPMSLYLDNSPKQFNVVQQQISYDGAIFQTITLQEKYLPTSPEVSGGNVVMTIIDRTLINAYQEQVVLQGNIDTLNLVVNDGLTIVDSDITMVITAINGDVVTCLVPAGAIEENATILIVKKTD